MAAVPDLPAILLTGFEPFDGDDRNPSQAIVQELAGHAIAGHRIVGHELPEHLKAMHSNDIVSSEF